MTYKGYSATMIELDEDSMTIAGRVALERGMATFEGRTVAEAIQAFRDTVEDYLALCIKHGIEPEPQEPPSSRVQAKSPSDRPTESVLQG